MSGPEVTHVPDARRPVVVKHGDVTMHLTVVEAQALDVRLERVLTEIIRQGATPDQLTAKQSRYLHALLRERGANGPERHNVLSRILQREISSVNDLSPDDASRCIDALRERAPEPEGTF